MEHKRTWIYCRVAYPDAHALAAQQANLEAYAEKQGFEIVGTTVEQASGMDFSRRGLAEVSNAVAAGKADLLLVANLSRLGRDAGKTDAYLRWLEDQFVEVVCADGTIPQTSTDILLALMKESGISLDKVR
jgi:DNA invertase Pin-like site-specific DNA recombinase